jgi:FAD synthetase
MEEVQLDEALTKKILGRIYVQSLKLGEFGKSLDILTSSENTSKPRFMSERKFTEYLKELKRLGLVLFDEKSARLTLEGRRKIVVVMIGGAFDIIHPGHIETLKQAKALGDVLAVSVARDSTYKRNKHKDPVHNERLRRDLVSSVKFVDVAVLGSEKDIFETVRFLEPDIIALGYDQAHSEKTIKDGAEKAGIEARVVRLDSQVPRIKTSSIMANDYREELLNGT